jgi:hypothetical protein
VASGEAVSGPSIELAVAPGAIVSLEGFGSQTIELGEFLITPVGIATLEQHGQTIVALAVVFVEVATADNASLLAQPSVGTLRGR